MNVLQCPDCRTALRVFGPSCPACALPLTGTTAYALWQVDLELTHLGERRRQLLGHRESLLAELRSQRGRPVPGHAVSGAPVPPRDLSPRSVQNLLLILGGTLVGIAATVFTVVSWGRLGIGGRAMILLGLTALASVAPWPLARRGLRATAEAAAGIGLVLVGLECFSAYDLDLFGLGRTAPLWYAAGVTAVIAAVWAGYGRLAPLRLPIPTSVVMSQLPLPLAVSAVGSTSAPMAAALITTAGLDVALRVTVRTRPVRSVADVCAGLTGGIGLVLALTSSLLAGSSVAGWRAAALLVLATGVGLAYAWRLPARPGMVIAGVAAVALTGAMAAPFVPLLPAWWLMTVYGAAGACVFAIAQVALPTRLRQGPAVAGTATVGATVLAVLPSMTAALLEPVGTAVAQIWHGPPHKLRDVLGTDVAEGALRVAPLVLAIAGVVGWAAVRRLSPERTARGASWATGIGIAMSAVAAVPAAIDLAYLRAIVVLFAAAAVLIAVAALLRDATLAAVMGLGGLFAAAVATGWSLADRQTTLAALAAAVVMSIAASAAGRTGSVRAGAASVAVVAAAGLGWAGPSAIGYPVRLAGFGVVAVAAVAAGAAALLRRHDVARAIEPAGWAIATAGVAMTASDVSLLSTSLALTGLIALGVSLRPDRRALVWAGAALVQLALWIRLGIAGVATPEAYTLPISVVALGFGLLRHRRSPTVPSWTAYGPGLTAALVPSLPAVWAEPGWIRPLLLGAGCVALAVAGAWARLQAPLLLGGAVLVLDALHELAPVIQLVGALPRWVPIAVIGLALLFLGATYERRLRDLHRLRDTLAMMH